MPFLFSKPRPNNFLFTIHPYMNEHGVWMFDYPPLNIHREALIAGIPEIILHLADDLNIARPEDGFNCAFSDRAFPSANAILHRVRDENGGAWYRLNGTNLEGWLCPCLLKFFPTPPSTLYLSLS